jgi:hypothetical protein
VRALAAHVVLEDNSHVKIINKISKESELIEHVIKPFIPLLLLGSLLGTLVTVTELLSLQFSLKLFSSSRESLALLGPAAGPLVASILCVLLGKLRYVTWGKTG